MASEGFQGCRRQLHGATAAFGLGGAEYRTALRRRKRAPRLQRSGFKINVAPLEAEQLALAEPGVDGEDLVRLTKPSGRVRWDHAETTRYRRTLGGRRTAPAEATAQAQGRQAARRRPGRAERGILFALN